MKHVISILLCTLVFFLPIQSLLGVFAVNRLGLPVNILLWKEMIEIIIMGILLFDIAKRLRLASFKELISSTWLFLLTIFITFIIITTSLKKIPFSNIFYGFRFELFWVFFLSIFYSWFKLADLETLEYVKQKVVRWIYLGFLPVLLVSYLTIILGQEKVLGFFGFGISNSKFLADIPISHVVDGGGWNNFLRLSGTFTTPNHFAGYLLLILVFFLYHTFIERSNIKKLTFGFSTFSIVLFIFLSFARFAWLAIVGWVIILSAYYLVKNKRLQKLCFITGLLLPLFIGIVAINLPEEFLQKSIPSFIAKPSSTAFHARRTFATLEVLSTQPNKLLTGYGLGASGPAAKDQYTLITQNPLYKNNIDTALKYYLKPEEIVIPENWFIQLVLNGGLIYAFLYSIIVLLPLYKLLKNLFDNRVNINAFEVYILLGMFSILIGNLFLHLWENQTIVIYYSLLILFMYKPMIDSSK
ncbi:MAG: hypothetical protein H7196_01070 [candidate division SR1 bacterium]|nr:hypothetical protein [candidate division SR1 bacterium]